MEATLSLPKPKEQPVTKEQKTVRGLLLLNELNIIKLQLRRIAAKLPEKKDA